MKKTFLLLLLLILQNQCFAQLYKNDSIYLKGYLVLEYSKKHIKEDYKNFKRQIGGKSFFIRVDDLTRFKLYLYDNKPMSSILKTSIPDSVIYLPGFFGEPFLEDILNKNKDFDTFGYKFGCLLAPFLYLKDKKDKLLKIYYFEALCTTIVIDTYSEKNLDLLARNSVRRKFQRNKNYIFLVPKKIIDVKNYFDKVVYDKSVKLYGWMP